MNILAVRFTTRLELQNYSLAKASGQKTRN